MSLSQTLDVAIGLVVVYYLLGSVVSLITQLVNETLETRGKALEDHLLSLVGEKNFGDLINLPQLQALRPIRYQNPLSVFSAKTAVKKLEKIPVSMLVESVFDISGLTAKKELQAEELLAELEKLPDSDVKTAFLTWARQGVTNVRDLRLRAKEYFGGILDQAAAAFRSRARSFVIIFSILVTVAFGTDSIQLAKTLWSSSELRALAVSQAKDVSASDGTATDIIDIASKLDVYSINISWWQDQQLPKSGDAGEWASFVFLKVLGLSLTAMAVSQGSSFWYDLLKKVLPTKSLVSSGEEEPK